MVTAASTWRIPAVADVTHGGPDALGEARHDFSSNANAAGPLPSVQAAVAGAARTRYPDPHYRALREHLAAWHGVAADRIVVAGSASEFIHRFTHAAARWGGVQRVAVPWPGYGDYAAAAAAAGLGVLADAWPGQHAQAGLCWITEPASPTGQALGGALDGVLAGAAPACVVLDLAYQPLRLDGGQLPPGAAQAWQLWSPNKACGLPGVRAAYAVAPAGAEDLARALAALAPSWVTGAEGVALLAAFTGAVAQAELAQRREVLRGWRAALSAMLRAAHWEVRDAASVTPFFVARPPCALDPAALRAQGIKLRDTASMGLPGWLRLSAQPLAAIKALRAALAQASSHARTGILGLPAAPPQHGRDLAPGTRVLP
jgi:histidinol-phosphate aminotransferase